MLSSSDSEVQEDTPRSLRTELQTITEEKERNTENEVASHYIECLLQTSEEEETFDQQSGK